MCSRWIEGLKTQKEMLCGLDCDSRQLLTAVRQTLNPAHCSAANDFATDVTHQLITCVERGLFQGVPCSQVWGRRSEVVAVVGGVWAGAGGGQEAPGAGSVLQETRRHLLRGEQAREAAAGSGRRSRGVTALGRHVHHSSPGMAVHTGTSIVRLTPAQQKPVRTSSTRTNHITADSRIKCAREPVPKSGVHPR